MNRKMRTFLSALAVTAVTALVTAGAALAQVAEAHLRIDGMT